MAKRFTATEIWGEDWFLEMPVEYKLFWYYMLTACDHAGLFKVNLRSFCGLNEVKISSEQALSFFNSGKERIRVVTETLWLIEDFFVYQYGDNMNLNNRVHESIAELYKKHGIELRSIRGLKDLKERVKDKDKDKDNKDAEVKFLLSKLRELEDVEIGEGQENLYTMIVLKMIDVFKKHNPDYFFDKEADYKAVLQIAYKIANMKDWKRDAVLNGRMDDCVSSWEKIVLFIKGNRWFSSRTLRDLSTTNEWQRLVLEMKSATPAQTQAVKKMVD